VIQLGLFCLLFAAFFSTGFHHFDEHFQILEFARVKLISAPPTEIPWEFEAEMRSSLQPWLVIVAHKILGFLNLENPFLATRILRLLTAILSWTALVTLLKTFEKEVPEKWLKRLVIPLSFFFWLSVYSGVRFSSENWGGICFALGLCLALRAPMLAGALLGISFLSRFQMGLMILGLGLWLILIRKAPLRELLKIALGFGTLLILGLLLDHEFYGGWPVTFWNYFQNNLIQGKAAEFGVLPWYEYFKILIIDLIPPFSLFFILGLLAFFWFYPKHILTFSLVPFLVVHSFLGHKEARFLLPILYFFPLVLGLGLSALTEKFRFGDSSSKFFRGFLYVFWTVNGGLLLAVMFHPADKDTQLYEAIYKAKPDRLLFTTENPFRRAGFELKYYQRPGLEILSVTEAEKKREGASKTLVASQGLNTSVSEDKVVYRSAPKWILKFNFNHWVERTRLWVLFWQ
jgi:phosphatidylinositol glycan class B